MTWNYTSGKDRHWTRKFDGLVIRPKSANRFVLETKQGETLDFPSLYAAQEYADRNIATDA